MSVQRNPLNGAQLNKVNVHLVPQDETEVNVRWKKEQSLFPYKRS